jgi:hypothetical protein
VRLNWQPWLVRGTVMAARIRPLLGAQAPMPDLPIRRGRAGAGLIAHVLTAKYCDHQPLHRQAEQYAREDVDLSRSTQADMVGHAASLLRPLVDALVRHVMSGTRVHADDTTVPVLAPDLGRTKTGRIWTCVLEDLPFGGATPSAAFYRYTPGRKVSTRASIFVTSVASSRPMAMPGSPGSTATVSPKRRAWHTSGANSSIYLKHRSRRWRRPRWTKSPYSTGSKRKSAAVRRASDYA